MAKKEQPLFVEFYNLHLNSETDPYPNEHERRRVIDFLSRYEPETTDQALYEEAARANADDSLMENGVIVLDRLAESEYQHLAELYGIADLEYSSAVDPGAKLEYKQVCSLAEYELYALILHLVARVKNTPSMWLHNPEISNSDDFIDSNGELCSFELIFRWFISKCAEDSQNLEESRLNLLWFSSDHFTEFLGSYRRSKSIVDGYMGGRILNSDLRWLNERLSSYRTVLAQKSGSGTEIPLSPAGEGDGQDSETILDDYEFEPGLIREKGAESYGIDLNDLMGYIYRDLMSLFIRRSPAQYCSHEPGERNPSCNNIFIPNKRGQKYCSDSCRLNYHNSRKAAYMRRKRDPDSPDFDIKYITGPD